MSLESDLYNALNAPAVTELVFGRIYPELSPQDGPVPYVVYSLVSAVPVKDMPGTENLALFRIQVDSIAQTFDEAAEIDLAIRAAMRAAVLTLKNTWDDTRSLPLDMSTRRFGKSSDFMVWHR